MHPATTSTARSRLNPSSDSKGPRFSLPQLELSTLLNMAHTYIRFLVFLLLAVPGWVTVWFVVTNFYPSEIQHTLLANSYLQLLLPFGWSVTFTTSFLLKNFRRGLWLGIISSTLLSLKLQHVELTTTLVLSILIFFGILELLSVTVLKLLPADENLQQTPRQRRRTRHRR